MISWKFQLCIPKLRFSHASTPTILFILVGALSVCKFSMVPGVYILLCPQEEEVRSSRCGHKYTHSATHSVKAGMGNWGMEWTEWWECGESGWECIECGEWSGNAVNQVGNVGYQGGNVGNRGGNVGNRDGNTGNQSENAGNQGGNARKGKVYKIQFSFFPEIEKKAKSELS